MCILHYTGANLGAGQNHNLSCVHFQGLLEFLSFTSFSRGHYRLYQFTLPPPPSYDIFIPLANSAPTNSWRIMRTYCRETPGTPAWLLERHQPDPDSALQSTVSWWQMHSQRGGGMMDGFHNAVSNDLKFCVGSSGERSRTSCKKGKHFPAGALALLASTHHYDSA